MNPLTSEWVDKAEGDFVSACRERPQHVCCSLPLPWILGNGCTGSRCRTGRAKAKASFSKRAESAALGMRPAGAFAAGYQPRSGL